MGSENAASSRLPNGTTPSAAGDKGGRWGGGADGRSFETMEELLEAYLPAQALEVGFCYRFEFCLPPSHSLPALPDLLHTHSPPPPFLSLPLSHLVRRTPSLPAGRLAVASSAALGCEPCCLPCCRAPPRQTRAAGHTGRQVGRQASKQAGRQAGGQAGRQKDYQPDHAVAIE